MNPYLKSYNIYRAKEPLFTRVIAKDTVEYYCRSRGYWQSDWTDYRAVRRMYMSSEYVIAECLRCTKHRKVHTTLADCAMSFHQDAVVVDSITRGRINFNKVGSYRGACLKYFFDCANGFTHTDIVQPDAFELDAIEMAVRGGITYYVPGNHTDLHQYDVNSFYPFLMSREYNTFPVKPGVPTKIEGPLKQYMPYGLYRAYVRCHEDNVPKLQSVLKIPLNTIEDYMCGPDSWYTHVELRMLFAAGYEVLLVPGGDCNAIQYPESSRVAGSKLFGKYVASLYALKRDERLAAVRPIVKALLNRLWGGLVYTQRFKTLYFPKDEPFNFRTDSRKNIELVIDEMTGETIGIKFEAISTSHGVLPWLKPFLLSYGRAFLMKHITEHFEHVVFAATDSIVSTCELPALGGGSDLLGKFSKSFYNNIDIVCTNNIKRNQARMQAADQSDEFDTELVDDAFDTKSQ